MINRILWAFDVVFKIQAAVEKETIMREMRSNPIPVTIAGAVANASSDIVANYTVYTGPIGGNSTHMGKMNGTGIAWVLNDDLMGPTDVDTVMNRGVGFYKIKVS